MLGVILSVLLLLLANNTGMGDRQGMPAMKLFGQGGASAVDTPAMESCISYDVDIWFDEPASCLPLNVVISPDLMDLPLSLMCCRSTRYFFQLSTVIKFICS